MNRTSRHLGPLACLSVASIALLITTSVVPVAAQGAWKELKTLSDWTHPAGRGRGGAPAPAADAPLGWHLENGVIVGGQAKPGERTGALTTNDKYMDFEMELEFQIAELGTKCSEVLGPEQQNTSEPACLYNSGINWRSGYQLNIGRREAGEYIGLVIHRTDPKAIRGNILWLSHGDREFPNLRKKLDWNTMRIAVKGDHMQTWLNGTKIVDVNDKSTIEAEASWRVPQPITIQMPYYPDGFVKFRNVRIRTL
jgi:hypothetical protein